MKLTHSPFPCMPYRYLIVLESFLVLSIGYSIRFCVKLALLDVTAPRQKTNINDTAICNYSAYLVPKPNRTYEYNWTKDEILAIKGSFFTGYAVSLIPSGLLSDIIGPKFPLIIGIFGSGIATISHPFLIRHIGFWGMVVPNFIIGVCQGLSYAALHTIVAIWIPKKERTTFGTIIFSAVYFAYSIKEFVKRELNEDYWPIQFYIFGGLGVILSVFMFFTMYNRPNEHPHMKKYEAEMLVENTRLLNSLRGPSKWPPWFSILMNNVVWSILIANFGHLWGFALVVNQLPNFMKVVLNYDLKTDLLFNSLTSLGVFFVSVIAAYICDQMINKDILAVTGVRKIFYVLSALIPSAGLMIGAYSGCDRTVSVTAISFGIFFMGFYYPSLKINMIEIYPPNAGLISGMAHTVGAFALFFVEYTAKLMTPHNTLKEWRYVFWTGFGIISLTTLYYVAFGSADVQKFEGEDGRSIASFKSGASEKPWNRRKSKKTTLVDLFS